MKNSLLARLNTIETYKGYTINTILSEMDGSIYVEWKKGRDSDELEIAFIYNDDVATVNGDDYSDENAVIRAIFKAIRETISLDDDE